MLGEEKNDEYMGYLNLQVTIAPQTEEEKDTVSHLLKFLENEFKKWYTVFSLILVYTKVSQIDRKETASKK